MALRTRRNERHNKRFLYLSLWTAREGIECGKVIGPWARDPWPFLL